MSKTSESKSYTATELGEILQKHRKKKNVSVGEVSERLKLPARHIQALENGSYDDLPEPVFVRGFLRSYAAFLDFDAKELDVYLDNILPLEKVKMVNETANSDFSGGKPRKQLPEWAFALAVLAVLGVALYAWQYKSQSESAKQNETPAIAVMPNQQDSALSDSHFEVRPMNGAASQVSDVAASEVSEQPQNLSRQASEEKGLLVVPRFRSMLTVKDKDGNVLIDKIVPARSEHRFTEGAPFEVRVGYSTGAQITFDGVEADLSSAQRNGRTLTVTAGQSAQTVQAAQ